MYPHKKRWLAVFVQPVDCVGHHIAGTTLDGIVTALVAITLDAEASIEETEAAIEAGRHACVGIKNERANECGGMVATLLEDIRQVRQQRRQRVAEIGDCMKLWVRPGKYCGVRNRRQGRLGISPFKNY